MPGYGVFARHVKGLELANIHVGVEEPDARPAMVCIDVDGLEVDNFKADLAEGANAARFEAVRGDVIRNSAVLAKDGAVVRKAEASTPAAPEPRKPRPKGPDLDIPE